MTGKRIGVAIEMAGTQFGRWTVIRKHEIRGKYGEVFWLCRCKCGTEKLVKAAVLRNGESQSCGCFHRERVTKHGMFGSREWKTWNSLLQRCENPNSPDYPRYGGRGISICAAWHEFEHFYIDMGDRPAGTSLDRINVDEGYCPENCRWASATVQQRNRRDAIMVEWRGKTKNIHDWAEQLGLVMSTLKNRLGAGWSVEEAFTTPARPKRPNGEGVKR